MFPRAGDYYAAWWAAKFMSASPLAGLTEGLFWNVVDSADGYSWPLNPTVNGAITMQIRINSATKIVDGSFAVRRFAFDGVYPLADPEGQAGEGEGWRGNDEAMTVLRKTASMSLLPSPACIADPRDDAFFFWCVKSYLDISSNHIFLSFFFCHCVCNVYHLVKPQHSNGDARSNGGEMRGVAGGEGRPFLSVVVASCSARVDDLLLLLQSFKLQTCTSFELLVVNNGHSQIVQQAVSSIFSNDPRAKSAVSFF